MILIKIENNKLNKMEKTDLFKVLIDKGILLESGLDSLTPYRIFEYKGKEFKLILIPKSEWKENAKKS